MRSRLITRTIAVAAGLAAALGGSAVASAATAQLLGLSPSSLQAVQREGTQVLPGLGNG
jgi:hypothetical protein